MYVQILYQLATPRTIYSFVLLVPQLYMLFQVTCRSTYLVAVRARNFLEILLMNKFDVILKVNIIITTNSAPFLVLCVMFASHVLIVCSLGLKFFPTLFAPNWVIVTEFVTIEMSKF